MRNRILLMAGIAFCLISCGQKPNPAPAQSITEMASQTATLAGSPTLSPAASPDASPTMTPTANSTQTPTSTPRSSIVINGDFETGVNTPDAWTQEAWVLERSIFRWEENNPNCTSKCVSITNPEENDARWIQSISVTPGEIYTLSGRMKGENIQGNPIGANLFVGEGYNHSDSENSTGTFDWKTVSMDFIGPPGGIVTIGCRLGYFGSTVTGTAYCDDISVDVGASYRVVEGRNIALYLERADTDPSIIRPESLSQWVSELDSAYDDYADLVGRTPFNGAKIQIQSTRAYPGGWAVAGNPILWHQPYVQGELSRVETNGDWSFGILHEIGHDFDIEDRWNFDAEFFANFKMYFVVVRLNAKVTPDGQQYYTGSELREFYRSGILRGEHSWDSINFRFITMADQWGREPFQKTFRFFLSLTASELPITRLEKFNLFLDKLSEFSGQDARSFFSSEELSWALEYLKE